MAGVGGRGGQGAGSRGGETLKSPAEKYETDNDGGDENTDVGDESCHAFRITWARDSRCNFASIPLAVGHAIAPAVKA